MKLRKRKDGSYTLKEIDENGEKTKEAHYKFVKIRDVKERLE
jgi:rRNA maturation protein Nop10